MTSSSYVQPASRFEASLDGLRATLQTSQNVLAARVGQRRHHREGNTLNDADLVAVVSYLRREIDVHYAGKRPAVATSSTVKSVLIERAQVSMEIVALSNGRFAIYAAGQRPKSARGLEEVLDIILDQIGEE